MNQRGHADKIRSLIRDTLVDLGAVTDAIEEESLLIRSGAYCGHRIEKDDFRAVWFIEEDEIKFYSPQGQLLRVLHPAEVLSRKAA